MPTPPTPASWPGVTVVIPAYREREVIDAKVNNTLTNGYPGPLEVIVVADDPGTAATARETPARVIEGSERRGKAAALNHGVHASTMPIVVLTDANAMMKPGGLAKLVRWFDDPTVGAVAGEKRIAPEGSEGIYWAFESWLKQREWRTGTTIGLVGELAAVRREAYVDLPADVAVDDLWLALDVVEQGRRVAYEPEAAVVESASASVADEWERRTRIVAGVLDVLWRRRALLIPRRSPVAGQLWGHRLIRSSPGPLAHAALLMIALRSVRTSGFARVFLAAHAFAAWSSVRERRGERVPRLGYVLSRALFLQLVGVGGTLRWLRGDRPARWPKPERTACCVPQPPAEENRPASAG